MGLFAARQLKGGEKAEEKFSASRDGTAEAVP
jgi:hypothetical protein